MRTSPLVMAGRFTDREFYHGLPMHAVLQTPCRAGLPVHAHTMTLNMLWLPFSQHLQGIFCTVRVPIRLQSSTEHCTPPIKAKGGGRRCRAGASVSVNTVGDATLRDGSSEAVPRNCLFCRLMPRTLQQLLHHLKRQGIRVEQQKGTAAQLAATLWCFTAVRAGAATVVAWDIPAFSRYLCCVRAGAAVVPWVLRLSVAYRYPHVTCGGATILGRALQRSPTR